MPGTFNPLASHSAWTSAMVRPCILAICGSNTPAATSCSIDSGQGFAAGFSPLASLGLGNRFRFASAAERASFASWQAPLPPGPPYRVAEGASNRCLG
jgi:hypothetical protein